MEIKTRKQAFLSGERTYYTGSACKNGHLTYRYTQSGSCKDCVHSKLPSAPKEPGVFEAMSNLAKLNDQFPLIKFRLYFEDRSQFADVAWAMAVMRNPNIGKTFIDPGKNGTDVESGTAKFSIRCHMEDVGALQSEVMRLTAERNARNKLTIDPQAQVNKNLAAAKFSIDDNMPDFDRKLREGTL